MSSQSNSQSNSKIGLYTTLGIGVLAIGGTIAAIPFLTPAMRKHALPYIPATPKQISNVFKSIKIYGSQNNMKNMEVRENNVVKLIDLGSGDGRIVFEAASRGFHATGVELNAVLCLYSKFKSYTNWKSDISKQIQDVKIYRPQFKRADFWKVNMSEYDLIVVFGVQEMMKDLGNKIKTEMKDNALIVSCRNPIPKYKSVFFLDDELDSVWVYNKDSLQLKNKQKITENYTKKQEDPKDEDDDDD